MEDCMRFQAVTEGSCRPKENTSDLDLHVSAKRLQLAVRNAAIR
jgi:hypothetical protein